MENVHRQFQDISLRLAADDACTFLTVHNERAVAAECHEEAKEAEAQVDELRKQAAARKAQEERDATARLAAELFASSHSHDRRDPMSVTDLEQMMFM